VTEKKTVASSSYWIKRMAALTEPKVNGLTIEFHLTNAELLHLFAVYMVANPKTDLEHMGLKKFREAVKEVLAKDGFNATKIKLSDQHELKKIEYKHALRGVVELSL
jgi:hypothetical protein